MARRTHTVSLQVATACDLDCRLCNRREPKDYDTDWLKRQITHLGGDEPGELRLWGCDPLTRADIAELVRHARREVGFERVGIVTNGLRLGDAALTAALADAGLSEVVLTFYSTDPRVHDAIVRRKGGHGRLLAALEVLDRHEVDVRAKLPLLSPRAQDLVALFDDLVDRVGRLAAVEVAMPGTLPPGGVGERLAPPPLLALRPILGALLERADDESVPVLFLPHSGVPFCGLPEGWRNNEVMPFNPTRPAKLDAGNSLSPRCGDCAMQQFCTGLRGWHLDRWGDGDLQPLADSLLPPSEPSTLQTHYEDPLVRARAANVKLKVVRPVIHCNQRCPFCSANETSENHLAGKRLKKKIVRWYRLGARRLSFSGGEPTLDDDLPEYLRLARQLGYAEMEIVTNGTRAWRIDYAKELVNAGLNRGFVSLHANNEALSAKCTGRTKDWWKTVQTIHNFLDLGVATRINHVITTINKGHIAEFVRWFHGEFGSDVHISFAFCSPLYRAAESPELVPRYSDVMPQLKEAMTMLREWNHPFVVLSRAGVPWCQLRGGFMQYSDLPEVVNEAHSEDAYKKTKGPQCDDCALVSSCPGVYKEYAEMYGTDELVPLSNAELEVSPTAPNDPWAGVASRNWGRFKSHMDAHEVVDWGVAEHHWRESAAAADRGDRGAEITETLAALGFADPVPPPPPEDAAVPPPDQDLPTLEGAIRARGLDRIEEVSYLAGIKPVLYLTPSFEDVAKYRDRYRADHHVEVVEARDGGSLGRGVSTATAHLFVSRDADKARAVADVYRHGDPTGQAAEVGELMGYPRCCVAAFLSLSDRSNDSEMIYAVAQRACARPHPLLNLGIAHLIPFYPCRFDCDDAIAFAEATLGALFEGPAGAIQAGIVRAQMSRPVLYFDKLHALIFDGEARDYEVRYDDWRFVSRTPQSRAEIAAVSRALGPYLRASRKLQLTAEGWTLVGPRAVFHLPRRDRAPGVLLPFGSDPATTDEGQRAQGG